MLASLKESVVPGEPAEGQVFDTLCDSQVARQLQMQVYNEEEKKQKPRVEEPKEDVVIEKPIEVQSALAKPEMKVPKLMINTEEEKLDETSQEIVDLVT